MPSDILGVFRKVRSDGFKITFCHDSPNCDFCLNGKLHITPKIKYSSPKKSPDDQAPAHVPVSVFQQIRQMPVVKHENIPEHSYSRLGINLTQKVISRLKLKNNYTIPQVVLTPIKIESPTKQLPQRKTYRNQRNGCRTCDCYNDKSKISIKEKAKNKLKTTTIENCSSRDNSVKNFVKKKRSPKLKSPVRRNLFKESCSDKEPNKGTLKRRRWNLQKLKKCNSNYEDDLFEDQKFCDFKTMDEETSNYDKYDGMLTPEISLSPLRDISSSPSLRDCYSPTELLSNRKEAEEYIYRREKRRRLKLQNEKSGIISSPESCKRNEIDTSILLEQTSKILKKFALKAEQNNKDSDEDEYFSDISDDVG